HTSTHPPRSYFYFFSYSAPPPDLPSFPTRRSSDLHQQRLPVVPNSQHDRADVLEHRLHALERVRLAADHDRRLPLLDRRRRARRSEEHTSELQSRGHLVCRLLLEKKKKNKHITTRV